MYLDAGTFSLWLYTTLRPSALSRGSAQITVYGPGNTLFCIVELIIL